MAYYILFIVITALVWYLIVHAQGLRTRQNLPNYKYPAPLCDWNPTTYMKGTAEGGCILAGVRVGVVVMGVGMV